VFAAVVSTVIENGGSDRPVAGLKPLSVLLTGSTTSAVSLLSVMLAEVICVICTVPEGALGPEKVTGRAVVWLRLNTIVDTWLPFWKANDWIVCTPFICTLSLDSGWFQVGLAPVCTVCSMVPPITALAIAWVWN